MSHNEFEKEFIHQLEMGPSFFQVRLIFIWVD
jgi:hypothetical protein